MHKTGIKTVNKIYEYMWIICDEGSKLIVYENIT